MLEFAYATGMRVTEIISLNISDVNIDNSTVTCKANHKQRVIPLGSLSLKALQEYIENARPILVKDENEEALSTLIKKYEPLFRKLAFSFVKNYKYKFLDVEDLVQQCRITTCYAIESFNTNNHVLFFSYLYVCLIRAINNMGDWRTHYEKTVLHFFCCLNLVDEEERFLVRRRYNPPFK